MTPQTVKQALAQARLVTDNTEYVVVKLPPRGITAAAGVIAEIGEAFCALIADKDEVTLVIPAEAGQDFVTRLPGHVLSPDRYRLITFDIVLDFSLVGFMAAVSTALAEAGISILAYGAYSRDHVLVPAAALDQAMTTLQKLQSSHS